MKVPFLKIQQKDFVFYMTNLTASYLKDHVNFHFREPYSDDDSIRVNTKMFLDELEKMGFNVRAQENGIQRRLQLLKVKKITNYLQSGEEAFFPNSIILSTSICEDDLDNYLSEDFGNYGFLTLPDSIEFQIVDGQHRLAGLFRSTEIDLDHFILPVILLFDVSLSTRAKIFADVNGNQTPVNMSNIYDLYGSMASSKKIEIKQKLHFLCKSFNEEKTSPLYKHVKMLGIGRGAISQSFFVNAVERALKVLNFSYQDMQGMYNSIFFYLKSYQRIFKNQWPVLENVDNMEFFYQHSDQVLKIDKSQALKTNGFGAIMRAFPKVYKAVDNQDFQSYYEIVSRLKDKVDWCSDNLRKGTGDKTQKAICEMLLIGMNLNGDEKSMRKIIVFPTELAVIGVDYNKDDEIYTARVKEVTEGLNANVLPQQGKSIELAFDLMKKSLERVNGNKRTFVIDIPDGMNDNTLIHDCLDLFNVKLSIVNSAHPEAAFNAIEKAGIDGEIVDKDNRIYPANSIHQILEMLKEASIGNYQYRFIAKKS